MYKILNRKKDLFGNKGYTNEFMVDTEKEISTLPTSTTEGTGGMTPLDNKPCSVGSTAYVVQTDAACRTYMLNTANKWIGQPAASSGGSGGSGGGISVVLNTEV